MISLKGLKIAPPLVELVVTERSGCRYVTGGRNCLENPWEQVLTWILEGLSRRVPFKIPGTMLLCAGKVQGERFAERGRS